MGQRPRPCFSWIARAGLVVPAAVLPPAPMSLETTACRNRRCSSMLVGIALCRRRPSRSRMCGGEASNYADRESPTLGRTHHSTIGNWERFRPFINVLMKGNVVKRTSPRALCPRALARRWQLSWRLFWGSVARFMQQMWVERVWALRYAVDGRGAGLGSRRICGPSPEQMAASTPRGAYVPLSSRHVSRGLLSSSPPLYPSQDCANRNCAGCSTR